MKGCLLFPGAILCGLIIGQVVTFSLSTVIVNERVTSSVGTGVWLMSTLLIHMYGSLLMTDPEEIRNPPPPGSTVQQWRMQKADRKLAGAELRVGVVFAFIGAVMTAEASGSPALVGVVAAASAILGGFFGHDFKRRVRRIQSEGKPAHQP